MPPQTSVLRGGHNDWFKQSSPPWDMAREKGAEVSGLSRDPRCVFNNYTVTGYFSVSHLMALGNFPLIEPLWGPRSFILIHMVPDSYPNPVSWHQHSPPCVRKDRVSKSLNGDIHLGGVAGGLWIQVLLKASQVCFQLSHLSQICCRLGVMVSTSPVGVIAGCVC